MGLEELKDDPADLLPSESKSAKGLDDALQRRTFAKGSEGPLLQMSSRTRKLADRAFNLLARATYLTHCRRTTFISTAAEHDNDFLLRGPSAAPESFGPRAANGGSATDERENGPLEEMRWKWESRNEYQDMARAWLVEADEVSGVVSLCGAVFLLAHLSFF